MLPVSFFRFSRRSLLFLSVFALLLGTLLASGGIEAIAATSTLSLSSSVDTNGDGIFADNGAAVSAGDTLTYRTTITSAAGVANDNVIAQSNLPNGTTYVSGSTTLDGGPVFDAGDTSPLMAGGFNLGRMGGGTFAQTDWSTGDFASADAAIDTTTTPGAIQLDRGGFEQDTGFSPLGSDLLVSEAYMNNTESSHQNVAILENGNYAYVYIDASTTGPTSNRTLFTVLAPDGSIVVPTSLVETAPPHFYPATPTGEQYAGMRSIVAIDGGFLIAWGHQGSIPDNFPSSVFFRRFALDGTPIDASPIVVATRTIASGDRVFLADRGVAKPLVDANGDIYIAYTIWYGTGGADLALSGWDGVTGANLFGPNASPLIVNDTPASLTQTFVGHAIAVNATGEIAATWRVGSALNVNLFTTSGISLGPDFSVPLVSTNTSPQGIEARRDNDFELTWIKRSGVNNTTEHVRISTTGSVGPVQALSTEPLPVLGPAAMTAMVSIHRQTGDMMFVWGELDIGTGRVFYGMLTDENGNVLVPRTKISASNNVDFLFSGDSDLTGPRKIVIAYNPTSGTDSVRSIVYLLPRILTPSALNSNVFDAGKAVRWNPPRWGSMQPGGSTVSLALRTGNTPTPDGTWTGFVSVGSEQPVPESLQGRRYLQYQVTLASDEVNMPQFLDFEIQSAAESHTFIFSVQVTAEEGTAVQQSSVYSDQEFTTYANAISNPIVPGTKEPEKEKDKDKDKDKDILPPVKVTPPSTPPPSATPPSNLLRTILVAAAGLAALLAVANFLGLVPLAAVGIYLLYLFTEPLRALFGVKKKVWGTVYNSLSKQPVDLAIVRLFDADGKLLKTRITDKKGRYSFLVDESQPVHLQVVKNGFIFPSTLVMGTSDSAYDNLNHGETIQANADQPIIPNLPVDPPVIDGSVASFNKKKFKMALGNAVSLIGTVLALVAAIMYPGWLTWGLLVLHVILYLLFRRLAKRKGAQPWGVVFDQANDGALPQAIARIFDKQYNRLLDMTQSDRRGRYAFLADKNLFYATFEHPDYQPQTTDTIDLTHKPEGGIVNLDVPMEQA